MKDAKPPLQKRRKLRVLLEFDHNGDLSGVVFKHRTKGEEAILRTAMAELIIPDLWLLFIRTFGNTRRQDTNNRTGAVEHIDKS